MNRYDLWNGLREVKAACANLLTGKTVSERLDTVHPISHSGTTNDFEE
jgi:hypothetical protein